MPKPAPQYIVTVPDATFGDTPRLSKLPPKRDIPGKRRLVKDVLPVGMWFVGTDHTTGEELHWNVTEETLVELGHTFNSQRDAGIRHGLYWGHSEGGKLDDRNRIDDIDAMWVEDGRLWMSTYVNDSDFADLQGKRRDVSIGVQFNWKDGTGKTWKLSPWHVAVVDHGTVPNQHPFIELAATQPTEETSVAMTFESTVAGINTLLGKVGMKPLPTEGENAVTEDNFDQVFGIYVGMVSDDEPEGESNEEEATGMAPVDESTMVSELSAKIDAQETKIAELSATIKGLRSTNAQSAESAFTTKLNGMLERGFSPEQATALKSAGAASGWDTSILDPFDTQGGLELGTKTGHLRTPNAPKTPDNPLSEDELAAAKARLGLK